MIDETRLGRLLAGIRGAGPFDRAALVDAVVALCHAVGWPPGFELDLNPVAVLPAGRVCASSTRRTSQRPTPAAEPATSRDGPTATRGTERGRRHTGHARGDAVRRPRRSRVRGGRADVRPSSATGSSGSPTACSRSASSPATGCSTCSRTRSPTVESDLAIRSAGLVRAALNHRLHPTDWERIADRLWRPGDRGRSEHAEAAGALLDALEHVVVVGDGPGTAVRVVHRRAQPPGRSRRASPTRSAACTTPAAPPGTPRAPSAPTATGSRRSST